MSLMVDGILGNANPSRIKKGSWFDSQERAFWRKSTGIFNPISLISKAWHI